MDEITKICTQCSNSFITRINYEICSFCWYENNWGRDAIRMARKAIRKLTGAFK